MTSDLDDRRGISRRKILECMTWAGTGVLWTIAGGMPRSLGIIGEATAAEPSGLTFLQISDSHVGFDKAANPNALGTLEEAVNKIKALPVKPSFVIHTGDITHLSKPSEFDDADRIISQGRLDVHYVPGEHDVLDEDVKLYRNRYGRGTKGAGWYSFDANGVHFIGLVNVVDLKAGGLGNLGNEQLEWLEDDLKGRSASTPIVVFAHIPLWSVYPAWGWGTRRRGTCSRLSQALRIGNRAQRSYSPNHAEGRGLRHVSHRHVDRLSAASAGRSTLAGTDEGRRRQAAFASRRYRCHLQAWTATPRDHRPAAAALRRDVRIMTAPASHLAIAAALAVTVFTVATAVPVASAQVLDKEVHTDQFAFAPQRVTVKTGTTVTWINDDDIPHTVASSGKLFIEGARYQRQILIHVHDARLV